MIIFQPLFYQYLLSIAFHAEKCGYVPVHPSSQPAPNIKIGKQSWTIDFEELRYVPVPHAHTPSAKYYPVSLDEL